MLMSLFDREKVLASNNKKNFNIFFLFGFTIFSSFSDKILFSMFRFLFAKLFFSRFTFSFHILHHLNPQKYISGVAHAPNVFFFGKDEIFKQTHNDISYTHAKIFSSNSIIFARILLLDRTQKKAVKDEEIQKKWYCNNKIL